MKNTSSSVVQHENRGSRINRPPIQAGYKSSEEIPEAKSEEFGDGASSLSFLACFRARRQEGNSRVVP
jgi:hypothetical protein